MKEQKIIILGAGVGGLSTAIALKLKGFNNILIYERRTRISNIGAGMVIWANASKIFDKLNLLEEIEKFGGRINSMQRFNQEGDLLGAIDANIINTQIQAPSIAISRNDLQNILIREVEKHNISIQFNHEAVDISISGNKTCVKFKNKVQVESNIVIGADGRMNSIARKYVIGNNKTVYQGFVNWVGILESNDSIFIPGQVNDFWGIGERFGIVPITDKKAYWAGGKKLSLNNHLKGKKNKSVLLDIFSPWDSKIKEIIQQTAEENIKYIEVFDHHPIKKWSNSGVCLIGDSAHAALPTSGQGACQAIEDAWHFSECLMNSNSREEAFTKFQKIRYQKTTAITMAGRDLAQSLFNDNPEYCLERNINARNTNYKEASKGIAQFWSTNLPQ